MRSQARFPPVAVVALGVLLATGPLACGGGGGGGGSAPAPAGAAVGPPGAAGAGCGGDCAQVSLGAAEVERIVGQGVAEAEALGVAVLLAVLDRAGNVLAVYQMPGSNPNVTITSRRGVTTGLEGAVVPTALAAISKAGTAAYLSSQGNAFSSRTANHIVQENFNPGEFGQPGGPLFGVQFSQLPCGDLITREGVDAQRGPKRMPLGFSADPGGMPLYLDGVPVGAVAVEFGGDGSGSIESGYSLDPDISDVDVNLEERIAVAASRGFEAPADRRADRITVNGKFLRFADDEAAKTSAAAPLDPANLIAVPFFHPGGVFRAGVLFQTDASGIAATMFSGLPAEVLVDDMGANRFPPTAAATVPGLTEPEVRTIMAQALSVAEVARSQIRRPLASSAHVSVSVVGTDGTILGIVRSRDAPVFGIDVSLQKARTAAFFSSATAAAEMTTAGFADRVAQVRAFLADPAALTGTKAFSDRAGGNLSRPFFPDGINGNPNGPLSNPLGSWSPFSTGFQLELVVAALADFLAGIDPVTCSAIAGLPNGIQIFPGSVPIYKGGELVGGIGISGDGVDQDDLISFRGLYQAGILLGTIANADPAIRADTIETHGVNLRFVNCPPTPFIGSSAQNVCEGI